MHHIFDLWYKLWAWLLANNGSRLGVILVVITGWYTFLTWRMAKAIASQTRAMIQPVALLKFHWVGENHYPIGHVEIKNLGAQPLMLLDVKLHCILNAPGQFRHFLEHYRMWEGHIIPPGESLYPEFGFKSDLDSENLSWAWMYLSYSLEVVASDLSKQVVLTYSNVPVLGIANVRKGMPLSVRWRYFLQRFKDAYHDIIYRLRPPKIGM
jgi:hypothetical protein